jgi:hypothetical protein
VVRDRPSSIGTSGERSATLEQNHSGSFVDKERAKSLEL